MELKANSSLVNGRLVLLVDGKYLDTYLATSGLPAKQEKDNQNISGQGPLPSCLELGGQSYTVATAPIDMRGLKGVDGPFFKIDPHTVSIWGKTRADFGIHRDANLPGSSGCIVLTSIRGWDVFQQKMSDLAKAGVKQLPLVVSYS